MRKLIKIIIAIALLGTASAASAEDEVAGRLAKLSDGLKKADANHNGLIDADEAESGIGRALLGKYFSDAPPKFPIAISDFLKVAEAQMRGVAPPAIGTAPPSSAGSAGSAPAATTETKEAPKSNTEQAAAAAGTQPTTSGPSTPSSRGGRSSSSGGRGSSGRSESASASVASKTSPTDAKPAKPRSPRFRTAKEIESGMGLPDWFLAKADADGQITMAEFTDHWTPEALAKFNKYDLNHDGIITAAECLKVEKRGGK